MISLILPIRNEANFIRQSLDAILAQDTPMDEIEILVADGMSTDGRWYIVQNHIANNRTYLYQAKARNSKYLKTMVCWLGQKFPKYQSM